MNATNRITSHIEDINTARAEIKRIRREIEWLHDAEREEMERLQWLTSGGGARRLSEEIAVDSPRDLAPGEYEHLEQEVLRIVENA